MEQFHSNDLPVCTLCMIFIMGVSLVYNSASTAQMSTVGKYAIQYCHELNFSEENRTCGTFYGNVSRIMKSCREENYSNSCNVYTNPEDDSILFCMKTKGVSQCINILCNSTFERKPDTNALEIIDTDTLTPSCVYKYATIESKDCVTNSSDEEMRGNTERRIYTNLSGSGWPMLLGAFLTGVMISSIFFYLRDWIRKRCIMFDPLLNERYGYYFAAQLRLSEKNHSAVKNVPVHFAAYEVTMKKNARHSLTSISVQTEDPYATNEGCQNAVYTDISNLQEEESSNDDASTNSNILDLGMYSGIDPIIPDVYNYSRPEEEQQSDTYSFLKGSEERMLRMGRAENVQNEKTLNDTLLTSGEQSLLTENQREDVQQLYFCLEKIEDVTLFDETFC